MSRRTERIGEQIRAELARLVRDELRDPRAGMPTFTRVQVAPDLATASVFWSSFGGEDDPSLQEVGEALESAAGFLRRRLASELALRRTPELRFRHDPSLELGSRTLALLREAAPGGAGDTGPEEES